MKITETDILTGESIERDATKEEIAALKLAKDSFQELESLSAAKEAEKAALLNRLGMTADEAKLLLS